MNIHGLDDPSLLVIFDQLAVEDLLRAGRVCSRWNAIRAKSALSRHSLTLLVDEHARDRIDNSKLDNIPYGQLLTDDYGMPLVPVKECADSLNEIVRNKISSLNAKFLAHLFPNITNFTVSIKSDIKSVHSLTCLLKVWSTEPKLTTLKLYTYDPRSKRQLADTTKRSLVSANRRLLSTINSISSLRVLTFDIDSVLFYVEDYLYVGDVKLYFSPILNRLERLHWHSCDFNWDSEELVDALTQFDNSNGSLKQIDINSEQMLCKDFNNWILKISPELALRFTQMCLQIDEESISMFSPFCERFTNLTSLQLVINETGPNFSPSQFFLPIASLTQLTYLSIRAEILDYVQLRIPPNAFDNFNFDQHRNNSVKVLKLRVALRKLIFGKFFKSLFLSKFFPNVQVFIFELIADDAFGTIKSAVVECDMKTLRKTIRFCTCSFANLKMIQSINPDREWSLQEILNSENEDSEQEDDSDEEEDDSDE